MSFVDLLDQNGLQTKDLNTLVSELGTDMQSIYGADIVIDANSPDGQLININSQAGADLRELITDVYTGFDPDQANGVVLDQRVAINNIQRKGGTYTVQPIAITVTQTVNLAGLDSNYNNPLGTEYTIQDNAGNKYILINSVTLAAGTHTVNFRASDIGAVSSAVNTITVPVTIVLGVSGVTNSAGVLSTGVNQETDAALKIRRIQSLAQGSGGYLNGLLGAVLGLSGVIQAKLYENVTSVVDSNNIPAHGIWLIVEGGSSADIAGAIYAKKSYGANMKGSQTYNIATASGGVFQAKWDVPASETLYIRFTIQTTIAGSSFNQAAIKSYIAANLSYGVGDYAETSEITTIALAAINSLGGGGVPVTVEISKDNINWYSYLTVTSPENIFTVSTANIAITVV